MSEVFEQDHTFYIGDSNDPNAKLLFEIEKDTLIVTSTFVKEADRGHGLGRELIDHAINYARKHKMKVDPVCSFAREVIQETPEYQIVLK